METTPIERALAWARALNMNQSAFARAMGVSPQDVTNWKRRGMPPEHYARAATVTQRSVDDLLGRTRPGHEGATPDISSEKVPSGLARPMNLDLHTVSPLVIWETLMGAREIPEVFKIEAPDDAMAPRVRAGQVVEFDRRLNPRPGDGVLVRDRDGNVYFRLFRAGRPGEWEAHAVNDAYRALDAARDGLEVLAVLVSVQARWAT